MSATSVRRAGRVAGALLFVVLTVPFATAGDRPPDLYALSDDAIEAQLPPGVRWVSDIAYRPDTGEAGLLDLVLPENPEGDRLPALVFIHGGGWRSGSKRRPPFILPALRYAAAGYVCISVNYRLVQEAPLPTAVEDVKTAVRWLRAHADEYQVHPDRIGAYGNSAGAHLALMLAMVGPDKGLEGELYPEYSSAVQAVCASAVPADLKVWIPDEGRPLEGDSIFLTGGHEPLGQRVARSSPITYVRADAPPLLLIHGTDDATVPVGQLDDFVEAMRLADHRHLEYLRIEGAGHMVFRQHADETMPAMSRFFARFLGGGEVDHSAQSAAPSTASTASGPSFSLLNLVRFTTDGRASFLDYLSGLAPILERTGSTVLFSGPIESSLVGGDGWDWVAVVRYPSRQAFLEMINTPEYPALLATRNDGVAAEALYSIAERSVLELEDFEFAATTGDTREASAPDPEAFAHFAQSGGGEPAAFLNLVRLKPGDGPAAYQDYGEGFLPIFERLGVEVLFSGTVAQTLRGDPGWHWVALNRYPSRDSFLGMVQTSEYQEVDRLRDAAIEDAHLYVVREQR
jgi:acetyl esterase/lipase/uncharacterized protein (DUF1330 family)